MALVTAISAELELRASVPRMQTKIHLRAGLAGVLAAAWRALIRQYRKQPDAAVRVPASSAWVAQDAASADRWGRCSRRHQQIVLPLAGVLTLQQAEQLVPVPPHAQPRVVEQAMARR